MAEENDSKAVAAALMLVAGGILGAGVALMLAPQSGKRTRSDVARYTRKMRRKGEDVVGDFSARVSEMVDTMGDKAEDILEKGQDLAYEAKKELLKALDEGQAQLEKQRARLAKLVG